MIALAMPAPPTRSVVSQKYWAASPLGPRERLYTALWVCVVRDLAHGHHETWVWLLSADFDWCAAVTLPGVEAEGLRERLLRDYWRRSG